MEQLVAENIVLGDEFLQVFVVLFADVLAHQGQIVDLCLLLVEK